MTNSSGIYIFHLPTKVLLHDTPGLQVDHVVRVVRVHVVAGVGGGRGVRRGRGGAAQRPLATLRV